MVSTLLLDLLALVSTQIRPHLTGIESAHELSDLANANALAFDFRSIQMNTAFGLCHDYKIARVKVSRPGIKIRFCEQIGVTEPY